MLTCSICGHRGLAKMFQTTPCNHSGCADCLMRGDNCSMCGHECALVPHPLIKAFQAQKPAVEFVRCASCPEDACAHCVACDKVFCEEHAAPHAEHETVDICFYDPVPPTPTCEEHGKALEYFVPPDRLLCADCTNGGRMPLAGFEASLRESIEFSVEACTDLIGRVNVCLDGARKMAHDYRATLVAVIEAMKGRNPEHEKRYTAQLAAFDATSEPTEAGLKRLECELMAIECRLDSLRAVGKLEGVHFMALAAKYSESLLRAMACEFTKVLVFSRKNSEAHSAAQLAVGMTECMVRRTPQARDSFGSSARKLRKARFLGLSIVMQEGDTLEVTDIRTRHTVKAQFQTRVIDFSVHDGTIAVLMPRVFATYVPATLEYGERVDLDETATAILLHKPYVYLAQGRKLSRYSLAERRFDRHVRLSTYVRALVSRDGLVFAVSKDGGQYLTPELRPVPAAGRATLAEYAGNSKGASIYVANDSLYFNHCSHNEPCLLSRKAVLGVDISEDYPLALVVSADQASLCYF